MKKIYTIEDPEIINTMLNDAEYGTLALCDDNKPYSLPINFVQINDEIYFHGAKKGKKIDFIKNNSNVSFSVVEAMSLLPSYFSTDKNDACPATQLFKSIIIDGNIYIVEDYDEKANALQALMEKLQKEGKYTPLTDKIYEKAINATGLFKLVPNKITCKFKLGQNFTKERYERVSEHLLKRSTQKDLETLKLIEQYYNINSNSMFNR